MKTNTYHKPIGKFAKEVLESDVFQLGFIYKKDELIRKLQEIETKVNVLRAVVENNVGIVTD